MPANEAMTGIVELTATATLVAAALIFVTWRILRAHRVGVEPVHEAAVVAMFLWCLWVVTLAFFPMDIVFYAWRGRLQLVPGASILELLRWSPAPIAIRNLAGNVALFVPFGILLPLLFEQLRRRPVALALRAAVASAAIELLQIPTGVHTTDVDDVVLNTTGAMLGFLLFRGGVRAVDARRPADWLRRARSSFRGEPLLAGAVPISLGIIASVALSLPTIWAGTLSSSDIERVAGAGFAESRIAARTDVGPFTFLLVESRGSDGGMLRTVGFKRVLPGRYTHTMQSDDRRAHRSGYGSAITAHDPSRGEHPTIVVWGRNLVGARSIRITAPDQRIPEQPIQDRFLIAFSYDERGDVAADGLLDGYRISFLDAGGRDITARFTRW